MFKPPSVTKEKNCGFSIMLVNSTVHFWCKVILYPILRDKTSRKKAKSFLNDSTLPKRMSKCQPAALK